VSGPTDVRVHAEAREEEGEHEDDEQSIGAKLVHVGGLARAPTLADVLAHLMMVETKG